MKEDYQMIHQDLYNKTLDNKELSIEKEAGQMLPIISTFITAHLFVAASLNT